MNNAYSNLADLDILKGSIRIGGYVYVPFIPDSAEDWVHEFNEEGLVRALGEMIYNGMYYVHLPDWKLDVGYQRRMNVIHLCISLHCPSRWKGEEIDDDEFMKKINL